MVVSISGRANPLPLWAIAANTHLEHKRKKGGKKSAWGKREKRKKCTKSAFSLFLSRKS